jgi:hypothetical protein
LVGFLCMFFLVVLHQWVYDEATTVYDHLLADKTVSLGALVVTWYLTLISAITYQAVNKCIRVGGAPDGGPGGQRHPRHLGEHR